MNKTFFKPVVDIVGWVERDQVPGWSNRPATVPSTTSMPALPGASGPSDLGGPFAVPSAPTPRRRARTRPGGNKADDLAEYLDDDLPDHLK